MNPSSAIKGTARLLMIAAILALGACSLFAPSSIQNYEKTTVVRAGWDRWWTELSVGARLGAYGVKRVNGTSAFIQRSALPGFESSLQLVAEERRHMSPASLADLVGVAKFPEYAGTSYEEAVALGGPVSVDFVAVELDRIQLLNALNANQDVLAYFRDVAEDGYMPRVVIRNVVLLSHEMKQAIDATHKGELWFRSSRDSRPRATLELRKSGQVVASLEEPKVVAYHMHVPVFKPSGTPGGSRVAYLIDEQPKRETKSAAPGLE